ncbi:MAG: ADYC domain-containing protein [Kofleriaceae bacterium]
MRTRHFLASLCFASLTLAACVDTPEVETSVAMALKPDDPTCTGFHCTGNSPIMEFYDFHELSPTSYNSAGLKLDGLWKGGVKYRPIVTGSTLSATRLGLPMLIGPSLVGSYLSVKTMPTATSPAVEYQIHITAYHQTQPYWTGPATMVDTYELLYNKAGGPSSLTTLCENPPNRSAPDGSTWAAPAEAILFAGDRYSDAKQITASTYAQSGDWFNIGCAGGALAKMHLNRFTTASQLGGLSTTRAERQDVLSMYTGNVCGTGVSYTVPATPLTWESRNGLRTLAPYTSVEAIWSGGRAICMDTWRLEATHPTLVTQMRDECEQAGLKLEPCGDLASWRARGTVLSANP